MEIKRKLITTMTFIFIGLSAISSHAGYDPSPNPTPSLHLQMILVADALRLGKGESPDAKGKMVSVEVAQADPNGAMIYRITTTKCIIDVSLGQGWSGSFVRTGTAETCTKEEPAKPVTNGSPS